MPGLSRDNAPLLLWMRKMDSSQNSTSIWWSKIFSTFIFSSKKIVLKIETRIFQFPNEILLELKQDFIENLLKIWKNIVCIFKMFFFDEKIKVEKKIGSSYRCRILSGIDFSHSWSDLTTPRGSTKKILFISHTWDWESPTWWHRLNCKTHTRLFASGLFDHFIL